MPSSEPAPDVPGTVVELHFPRPLFNDDDYDFARRAISHAGDGVVYRGYSLPRWYTPDDLRKLFAAAPEDVSPSEVIAEVFGLTVRPFQPTAAWAEAFICQYADMTDDIGALAEDAIGGYYRRVTGSTVIDGATIPFCVEAWVTAEAIERGEDVYSVTNPLINRSPALAEFYVSADSTGLRVYGCGIDLKLAGPKRAFYTVELSVITPFLRLTSDGKAPYLGDFRDAVETAIKAAAGEASRYLVRPPTAMNIAEAAWIAMPDAYLKASDNGTLPAKARQIMYAARGRILELTGLKKFSDHYFTQTLLPKYMQEKAEETSDWDVIYDARGHLTEPHTQRVVPLGTLQVREYLGQRQLRGSGAIKLADGVLYPTTGPTHRYRNVLFIEKEGFDELWEAVQLAERFDIAAMSTKGMSVVAARQLLDEIAPLVDRIFVLHDFDISGFSIFGTLGTDSRRYEFSNDVESKVVDIGLRLADVEAMALESETVEVEAREARRETLYRHGATDAEVAFLAPHSYDENEDCRRVELNAMTSRQLVDFVEAALRDHGVEKVIPDSAVLELQARHRLQMKLTNELLAAYTNEIAQKAATMKLPRGLAARVRRLLAKEPHLSWDQALARIIG